MLLCGAFLAASSSLVCTDGMIALFVRTACSELLGVVLLDTVA